MGGAIALCHARGGTSRRPVSERRRSEVRKAGSLRRQPLDFRGDEGLHSEDDEDNDRDVDHSNVACGFHASDPIVIVTRTGGGGGYGNPLARPFAEVAEDVGAGLVSRDKAWSIYGVRFASDVAVDEKASRPRAAVT